MPFRVLSAVVGWRVSVVQHLLVPSYIEGDRDAVYGWDSGWTPCESGIIAEPEGSGFPG